MNNGTNFSLISVVTTDIKIGFFKCAFSVSFVIFIIIIFFFTILTVF